ncbi:GNAT family N-acetyltransferase [Pullulanibacillus sp. KACC 23026]|uniref:GNAT family N-acetyltransferase n=1 Tax=Pullulanibacillus sp. KACC 23026 TaxID=3028315 RepID=UPI0023AF0A5C|nr:GNAT family N-acetyltransferase [Pullulanibacillus sp. KACC 23026]WEG12577.1 GNAT family N-acetyltransferase [Pullulanibacillus sp. KACC 23026]
MVEIRRLQRGEEQMAYRLSDRVFRNDHQKSMGLAFPSIFLPDVISHSYGGFVDGELVAFFGLVPSTIKVGPARLQVYSIGSVCTHPGHRGQGYAAAILDQILEDLKQTEACLLLVSGDRSLYTRVGCRPFGQVNHYKVSRTSEPLNSGLTIREMEPQDLHACARLARERETGYDLSVQDFAILIEAEAYASCLNLHHKVLVLKNDGEVKAFLAAGIPNNLDDSAKATGIEWAGEPYDVVQLAKELLNREELTEISLPVPWHDSALQKALEGYEYQTKGNQGTILIINPDRLVEQAAPYYKQLRGSLSLSWNKGQGAGQLFIAGKTIQLSLEEMLQFFFNPEYKKGAVNGQALPFPYTAGLNYI